MIWKEDIGGLFDGKKKGVLPTLSTNDLTHKYSIRDNADYCFKIFSKI